MNQSYISQSLFSVEGKKALVVGGTRGLGKEMAICLMENGCDVVVTGRHEDSFAALAEGFGDKVSFFACDICVPDQVKALMIYAEEKMGRIDILINSAGMNKVQFMEELSDEDFGSIIDLNLKAMFTVMREAVKVMRKHQYGKIINVSSMKSFLGTSEMGYTAYCASKGGVNMLTKQVACETAADHITVNAIAPTFIETDINRFQLEDEAFKGALEKRIPIGRIGQFKNLMGVLLLLASDASEFLTGQVIPIEGGILARQE